MYIIYIHCILKYIHCIYNPWHDKQRTDNLSKVVSVQKDNKGKLISSEKLEKISVQNGVSVHKTFHMKKSDTTGMVLNSQNDVDVLTAKLRDVDHSVVKVSTRVPTVHIVGLSKEYTPDELRSMIVKQNPGISTLFESTSTSTDDKLIDILAVKPLKNNVHIFKAIVKVSNVIRSILAKQQNKVYIGYQSMCKVYDSIFVLRCFNCQGYGHHSEECENKDDPVCGFCSESHESRDCLKRLLIIFSSVVTVLKQKTMILIIILETLGVLYLLNIRTELNPRFLFIKANDWVK